MNAFITSTKIASAIALLIISPVVVCAQSPQDRYPFGRDDKVGFIDYQGREVIPPRFSNAGDMAHFDGGLAPVFEAGKRSGYIDKSGRIVIPLKYDWASPLSDGLARVRIDIPNGTVMTEEGEQPKYRHQYGFVDHEGNEVIPLQFEEAHYFSEGYAMVVPSNFKLFGIVDKRGNFVHGPEFESGSEFHEGWATACVNHKCGYIDTNGGWVIPPTFTYARDFWHGLASVSWKEGEYGYVDKNGRI